MKENKNFALIGVAGYIAPRHLKAIKETGNNLVACLDKFDSVGIMDSYFPKADFFVDFEKFDSHIAQLKRNHKVQLDYVSICTPNYLHNSHVQMALRHSANAICEKPLVLSLDELKELEDLESEYQQKVYTILQLRLHPSIIALKNKIDAQKAESKYDVDLTYITSRGNWYDVSWKGDETKSGGVAANIGIHFFDMLGWIFGDVLCNYVHLREKDKVAGYLEFEKARVRWFLSIDEQALPNEIKQKGQRTYRSITVDGQEIEFSNGFTDLHTLSYQEILKGAGFGIVEAKKSIEIVHGIMNQHVNTLGECHEFLK